MKVLVIGAGAGGLAAAADLARNGCAVTVLERAAAPGGKMRQVPAGDVMVDAGPTVFTMKWVFDGLFNDAGEALGDAVELSQAEVLARHAWTPEAGGGRLDLFADVERSADAIAAFAGREDARAYRAFCEESAGIYRTLEPIFITAERPDALTMAARAGLGGLPDLIRTRPFERMAARLQRRFKDPRLAQLFSRYATYCGASPFAAPATLSLVAHVEQVGVHLVKGGMAALARAMAGLAERNGATIRYGAHVDEILIRHGRAAGVRMADGEDMPADAVVFNGDVSALGAGSLGPSARRSAKVTPRIKRSLSAVTWMVKGRTDGFPLHHHTVFFAGDYREEFRAVFDRRTVCPAPTVYVCAADRSADEIAPAIEGPERLLLLINAPADGDRGGFTDAELADLQARTHHVLERCGLALTEMATARAGPAEFEGLFPGSGGALYGPANHGPFASLNRMGARTKLPGLYLCGGSVHPGPGVPMATLSGRIAAARALADREDRRGSIRISAS